jgi:DNA polymerase III epsilon subunit-like protein
MIDKRKNYYAVIDTETANGLDDSLMYDFGCAIVDKKGKVYATMSYIIWDIFCNMSDLMKTCYFKEKVPKYWQDIKEGKRKLANIFTVRREFLALCKKYNIIGVVAHNMRFDYRSTNRTLRYLTKSKYRYFLPYGVKIMCSLKMAKSTVCKQKSYIQYCREHNYLTKNGQVRATAEILYKYIQGNKEYKEEHTALEDVLIEKDIFTWCLRQHKKMTTSPFNSK